MNKANGGDGIPVELFQILEDDVVKVLLSICQKIWKTQQWPQDCKRSVFIPFPKKGNAKECSMEYYSAIKGNTFESVLMRWMNLEPCTEWRKSEREREISYTNANIWNLERWYWLIYLQCSSGKTDIENRLIDIVGRREKRGWNVRRE